MAGLWACLVPSVQVEHKVYSTFLDAQILLPTFRWSVLLRSYHVARSPELISTRHEHRVAMDVAKVPH